MAIPKILSKDKLIKFSAFSIELLLMFTLGIISAFSFIVLIRPLVSALSKNIHIGQFILLLASLLATLTFLLLVLKYTKETSRYFFNLFKSYFVLGFLFFSSYYYFSKFNKVELIYFFALYFFSSILTIIYTKYFSLINTKVESSKHPNPHFIPDDEGVVEGLDLLNINEQVEHFSRVAINNYSSQRLVVGLEGEWGVGKSTFLNYCYALWKRDPKVSYMTFSAFKCHGDNFLEMFIEQLDAFLKELLPDEHLKNDLRVLFNSVSVKWIFKIPFTDIEITSPFKYQAVNSAERLKEKINSLNKRLIIVIDDMDRVGIEQIREVSRIVRYSSIFETTTFILCYDLTNLVSTSSDLRKGRETGFRETFDSNDKKIELRSSAYFEQDIDNKNLSKFLEKIVNVKYVLVHTPENLTNFLDYLIEKYD